MNLTKKIQDKQVCLFLDD